MHITKFSLKCQGKIKGM